MVKMEFNGQCAFATSLGKKQVGSIKWKVERNGKTYLFSNPIAKFSWIVIPGCRRRAEKNWNNSK